MIKKKISEAIKKYDMLNGTQHITVALSGGADSVALLEALLELRDELGITVSAAHLNHMIRGAEAERDESFVRRLCEDRGVKLEIGRENIPELAEKLGQSMELAARNARYAFLEKTAPEGVIATAHTASDQIETMLFNLIRGSGADGLCGIPPVRNRIIRPLLGCTRFEIEAYCAERGLEYVTDSTNLSDDYTRNRLRHLVIPQLKKINPAAELSASRCADFIREDCSYLKSRAAEAFEKAYCNSALKLEALSGLEPAILNRVLRRFYEMYFSETDAFHIERLAELCKKNGKYSMPGGFTAYSDGRFLVINDISLRKIGFITKLIEENVDFSKDTKKIHNLLLNNALDCDKIVGMPVVRSRRPGDTVRLYGRNCSKSLKKLYNEYAVPIREREELPVISDDCGVICVYGIGVAARCAVTGNTKRILRLSVEKQEL